jgi:diguanylate cyclase (GGDEF)-like protein/PAS domain S-box-containing protein
MSGRSSIGRTLGFAVLYVVATYAGRLTVMDETNLSLVWPAAGVSAMWFLVQYKSRWRLLDGLALSAVTMVVNMATGAPASLAMWFVAANLLQAWTFAWLFRRWLPQLWGGGGDQPLARPNELWRLTAASLIGTTCGALVGPTGIWAVEGSYSWPATAVWLTRNTVSILLIGAAAIRLGHLLRTHLGDPERISLRARWSATPLIRRAEYCILLVISAGAYAAVFGINHRLPLAFAVIVLTVWAGSRLNTAFVVLHDLVFGTVAILFTLHGNGVFAQIGSHPARALVAQVFVGVIAVVGLALALGRDERMALFHELHAAQHATARQNKMMTAIVDSMAEGLTVVDDQGRFLLRNPAVRRLIGGVISTSGEMAGPNYYGLFRPDGTLLDPDEMPYRRALAGTDVRGMDVLVRNPGVPQGRILSVSSTALPDEATGGRYAVSVFHDVTAERRHRDELALFAGVVAHDLLNPLATIEGWSELLGDTVGEGQEHDIADAVGRIRRAAARMRNMINNLLAYTTARDAALAPTLIDLGALVNDVALAGIDQAESAGLPVPTFRIGELKTVYADPVLVRQLLENLISNAIKYTASGVVPHISITTDGADGLVAVTIEDNGVGIPAGQHDSIFDNFHRAHRTAGYSGTGLGLGICKRIVERHGGTIRAVDNPTGHGSRLTFTLPADMTTAPILESDTTGARAPGQDAPPDDALETGNATDAATSDEQPEPAVLPVGAVFEHAAHLVLDFLHERMPLAFWAVTRVENGRQTYLYLDADNGYGLRQGGSHPWQDSFCVHMAAGRAPMVALDAQAVPAYANAKINETVDIGTYAGAAITEPNGTLFGAICGLDPQTHTDDPRMADAQPLLVLLGQLLTTALAADRAQDRSTNALVREQFSAETDALTGLPNRRAWERVIEQAQASYERLADPTVTAMLDLDRLKVINDSQGHAAGDAYLMAAATAARRALRGTDVIARLGGDEFGLLLRNCTEADAPAAIARIYAELEAAGVEGSIGWAVVTMPDGFTSALEHADAAMYATKQERRQQREIRLAASHKRT